MASVYEIVTERVVNMMLADNIAPWHKEWKTTLPMSLGRNKPYRGINVFLLGALGYSNPWWVTVKECLDRGGRIKREEWEKHAIVVFSAPKRPKKGEPPPKKGQPLKWITRYYKVWNVTQTEGLDYPKVEGGAPANPIGECERLVDLYADKPPITYGGDRACYIPSLDMINMPARESFSSQEAMYSTLFHELTHSTGSEKRLSRVGVTDPIKFGSHNYSYEELIAEMGAAFMCAHAGIVERTIDNSAAYIAHWVKKLRSEPTWVYKAGQAAQKAADYMMGNTAPKYEEPASGDIIVEDE